MRIVMFYHSLVSDWNHGNAHFLRGIVTELMARGHDVQVYEPRGNESRTNLEREQGVEAIQSFHDAYPLLSSTEFDLPTLDVKETLAGADLVIVHEWNDSELIARIGAHRGHTGNYALLFHDTHHRSLTDPARLSALDLRHYDGVLAFGDAVTHMYVERGWSRQAWTWHEAADVRVFYPRRAGSEAAAGLASVAGGVGTSGSASADAGLDADGAGYEDTEALASALVPYDGDVVWIGNFGDGERTAEIDAFLLEPVRRLRVRAAVYGVRYPDAVIERLAGAGIEYRGWLANDQVPEVFAAHKVTIHIPRAPYVASLPGIPTIRPFEAMACGIPLVTARWQDSGGLFTPGEDFLVAQDTDEMTAHLKALLTQPRLRARLARRALNTVHSHHTCGHRVDELLAIYRDVRDSRQRDTETARLLVPAS